MSFHTDSHYREPNASAAAAEELVRLDDAQRQTLAAIADQLIPGGEGMPSATEAKVHEKWIDKAFDARPDLAVDLVRIIDGIDAGDPAAEIARLKEELPGGFSILTTLIAGSYFMNPRVRKILGYASTGPIRRPAYEDEGDYFLRDGLAEEVIARGPIYRPTPGAHQSNGGGA